MTCASPLVVLGYIKGEMMNQIHSDGCSETEREMEKESKYLLASSSGCRTISMLPTAGYPTTRYSRMPMLRLR